jgi:hypothetical protein
MGGPGVIFEAGKIVHLAFCQHCFSLKTHESSIKKYPKHNVGHNLQSVIFNLSRLEKNLP